MKNIKSRIKMYTAGISFLLKKSLFWFLKNKNLGKTRVLVFHHLDEPGHLERVFSMLNDKYNLISFDQYLSGEVRKDSINVIISFDDGYQSWHTHGLKLFQKHQIKPLLFINSDFIDLNQVESMNYCLNNIHTWPEKSLTWQEIIELKTAGADIGGHSVGHVDMISEKNSKDLILNSVGSDREKIGLNIGSLPRLFAYPFGRHNNQAKSIVKESGYKYGFTSDSGFLDDSLDFFSLRRTNVGMRPPFIVEAMVEGWYDVVTSLFQSIKRVVKI